MISEGKLESLRSGTRLRKIANLLQGFEEELRRREAVEREHLFMTLRVLSRCGEIVHIHGSRIDTLISEAAEALDSHRTGTLLRLCNDARHLVLRYLGIEPADWDLLPPWAEPGIGDGSNGSVSPRTNRRSRLVYLDDVRSPYNVGSIFRSAESFGIDTILLSPDTPHPTHPRAQRSAMGCVELVRWEVAPRSVLSDLEGVFALETGGTPLPNFTFPEKGCVVVGNEELGVSPEARRTARNAAGIVSIPTSGIKGSLNAASAFAILMYCWRST